MTVTARPSHGERPRRPDAVTPTEHVGPLDMHVVFGRPTVQGAERWTQRTDALTAWLAAEWRREWISRRPRGRGRPEALRLPATPEDDNAGM